MLQVIANYMELSENAGTPNHQKLDHFSIETHGSGDPPF